MNRHPGGEAQTLHLLENIEWKKEMKALDLGAGEGDTVRILKSFGLEAHGVGIFSHGAVMWELAIFCICSIHQTV